MASRESTDMTGGLWRVDEKRSAKSPDYTGQMTVGGRPYRLAGWIREGRQSGKKYLSLKISVGADGET